MDSLCKSQVNKWMNKVWSYGGGDIIHVCLIRTRIANTARNTTLQRGHCNFTWKNSMKISAQQWPVQCRTDVTLVIDSGNCLLRQFTLKLSGIIEAIYRLPWPQTLCAFPTKLVSLGKCLFVNYKQLQLTPSGFWQLPQLYGSVVLLYNSCSRTRFRLAQRSRRSGTVFITTYINSYHPQASVVNAIGFLTLEVKTWGERLSSSHQGTQLICNVHKAKS